MFSKVLVTGLITNMSQNEESKITYVVLKVLKTILLETGPKSSYAEVIIMEPEGYEKYSGKLEIGDQVLCFGRLQTDQKGAPVFSTKDGLPHFVVIPNMTKNLGKISAQTGYDILMVTCIGNVGRDPEPHFTDAGTMVTNVNLATTYETTIQGSKVKETTWWKFTAWNKLADTISQYVKKGSKLYLEGDLQYDEETHGPKTFEDKTTKALRSSFEVRLNTFKFLPSSSSGSAPREAGYLPEEGESVEDNKPEEEPQKTTIPF